MKLISLLEKIGFGKYTSKEVDDVVVDKFEDFGVYVGQLYQKFLNKDVSSDPAIAQKSLIWLILVIVVIYQKKLKI